MTDAPKQDRPTALGIFDRSQTSAVSGIELAAAGLSVFWIFVSVAYAMLSPREGYVSFLVTLMAIFLPVAMIWVAAVATRSARIVREESERLQNTVDALRQAYVAQAQGAAPPRQDDTILRTLSDIARSTQATEAALTSALQAQPAPDPVVEQVPQAVAETDQPALALGTQFEDAPPPLAHADLIRALNFPETAEDTAGFDALRRAMQDRNVAQLVTAAQDVLTLLSQDGIYMDDLVPDRARPELWRHFADGARGRAIAPLGGIRDRSSLALSAGRMKQDAIFRDASHHFLRKFDSLFSELADTLSDEDITLLADTRTARAFMLLGRVAGTFD